MSYLLEQNKLRFVLTASLVPDDEIARHVMLHGDGVKDVAILVADAKAAFEMAVRGAPGPCASRRCSKMQAGA